MKWNFTGITMAAIAAAMLVVGCGQQKIEQASASSSSEGTAVVAQASAPVLPAATGESSPPAESLDTSVAEMPSPEVAASVSDTLVTPGGVVEITAEASEDAVELQLQDDLGRKQPFAYDGERKLWRTTYRVPMRLDSERLALSVTARNDAHRWRRVWVFLGVKHEGSSQ